MSKSDNGCLEHGRNQAMNSDELSDEQLLYIVGQSDGELFRDGMDIKRRYWEVPRRVMQRLGYSSFVMAGRGEPAILKRIESAFNSIYRPQDLATGGHIGVFMYRDIFARIAVPRMFGQVGFNPLNFVELTPVQLRIIQTEPDQIQIFLDQFCDVADVQYGADELRPEFGRIELARRYVGLARLHLHAAAAILTGGYDFRGAVHSAVLATELGLKSAAAAQGLSEDQIHKKFFHELDDLVDFVATEYSLFDSDRVRGAISRQPHYSRHRYAAEQPTRLFAGHTVMGAQYVVSEVVRQMSDRNFRESLQPPSSRFYPAIFTI
jgi:hypothetical protein